MDENTLRVPDLAISTLRPATEADCTAIAAIWNPVIRDTLVTFSPTEKTPADILATIRQKQAEGHAFFVAADATGILGFALYGQFRAGLGYAHAMEHSIALHPAACGRGFGRGLMQAVEDHARSRGVHCMIAGVSGANPDGVAFHAALGYATVATVPQVGRKAGLWLDLVLMQKFL
ncbi:GNAT family N-acetyltransferase [Roseicitreum antarcticum]|uniref:Phosphinothricin acetyltransferase n=1 Tax=Roseicitreum antarcticum TaxID=564137 RepID=A0A1H2VVR8_9RHOB|nr:GNAT family N-acetyltransferase [Roseicitreum antarcticum]SDW72321.1 phosphinothricin acetyltransferase [Roseicitreum antarcticum]